MERMEGEEYSESELVSEEEYLAQLENDDGLYDATVDAVNRAIEYIKDESGIVDEIADDTGSGQEPAEVEQTDSQPEKFTSDAETEGVVDVGMAEQTAETADGETVSTDPLQQARSMYTGISGEPQEVTLTTDTFQQIQEMANIITNTVVGAALTVDFAEGDGIRYFYLMLAEPYGTTTNSAVCRAYFHRNRQ